MTITFGVCPFCPVLSELDGQARARPQRSLTPTPDSQATSKTAVPYGGFLPAMRPGRDPGGGCGVRGWPWGRTGGVDWWGEYVPSGGGYGALS